MVYVISVHAGFRVRRRDGNSSWVAVVLNFRAVLVPRTFCPSLIWKSAWALPRGIMWAKTLISKTRFNGRASLCTKFSAFKFGLPLREKYSCGSAVIGHYSFRITECRMHHNSNSCCQGTTPKMNRFDACIGINNFCRLRQNWSFQTCVKNDRFKRASKMVVFGVRQKWRFWLASKMVVLDVRQKGSFLTCVKNGRFWRASKTVVFDVRQKRSFLT